MSLSPRRTSLALLALAALVAALLATAPRADAAFYACKKPSGTLRLVSRSTRCRRGQTKISWGTSGRSGRNGNAGANGRNGANGLTGARGPAGAYDVIDQAGTNLGAFIGFSVIGPMVYLPSGVILSYDNVPTTNGIVTPYAALYYKLTGCGGTPYTSFIGSFYPFETPIVLNVPASPGSPMWSAIPGTMEGFTYESVRTSSGCTNTRAALPFAFQVRENGVVPIAQEPLRLRPAS